MFTLHIGDAGVLHLGLLGFPPVLPLLQYQLCSQTSAGAILSTGAQHSCLLTYNSVRLHLHGLIAMFLSEGL